MTNCSRCGQPIVGEVERLTTISDAGGTVAHFYCFYPGGTRESQLALPRNALERVKILDSKRAKFFHESSPADRK